MTHKSTKNIFIAFVLNFIFSMFELIGGLLTGSVAIASDAIHDFGDAISIGLSYFFERKSKTKADLNYTYGYARYSVLGSIITTIILIFGSIVIIGNAILRFIDPVEIKHDQMIVVAVVGFVINFIAAFITRGGDSMNQKAVNLHMLEDVLGWAAVLIGSIVIKFTNFDWIDPMLSICVSIYILINAFNHFKKSVHIFTDKSPVNINKMKDLIEQIDGVINTHHIHIWTTDGKTNYATLHVVTTGNHKEIKMLIRDKFKEMGIEHVTIELESKWEHCNHKTCNTEHKISCSCCDH